MNGISELTTILNKSVNWNKCRLDCFVKMVVGLFIVRTINLFEIATVFASDALIDSRYKRIKRFFAGFDLKQADIARWVFTLFFPDNKKFYVTIDRTNWYVGKAKINMLTLAIAYEGIAIPLFWTLLNKAGNATAQEHIDIIKRFVDQFGHTRIAAVLGDREFASGKLFKWCRQQGIPYNIRVKAGINVRYHKRQDPIKASRLFKQIENKHADFYPYDIIVFGETCYLSASRSDSGELLIVATTLKPKNAVAIYLRRWEIENLFQCLKGRGFRFEETHVTKLDRIDRIMSLLTVGFCWAHKTGEWRALKKPIRFNQHRDSRRPQNSYFRYGYDYLRSLLIQSSREAKCQLTQCVRLLLPPDISNLELKT